MQPDENDFEAIWGILSYYYYYYYHKAIWGPYKKDSRNRKEKREGKKERKINPCFLLIWCIIFYIFIFFLKILSLFIHISTVAKEVLGVPQFSSDVLNLCNYK